MSLRAVVEIVIHLESFRNIDLFFQGIYYTRFRVHSRKKQLEVAGKAQNTPSQSHTGSQPPAQASSATGDRLTASANDTKEQAEYAQPYCSYVSYYQ